MHLVIAMDLFSHNILNYELLTVRTEISRRRRGTIKLANLGVTQKIVSKELGMLANIVAFILHAFRLPPASFSDEKNSNLLKQQTKHVK